MLHCEQLHLTETFLGSKPEDYGQTLINKPLCSQGTLKIEGMTTLFIL